MLVPGATRKCHKLREDGLDCVLSDQADGLLSESFTIDQQVAEPPADGVVIGVQRLGNVGAAVFLPLRGERLERQIGDCRRCVGTGESGWS